MKAIKNPGLMIAIIAVFLTLCGPAVGSEPTEGLVARWRFDEGIGTTAYDSAGTNNGTVYGAQWTIGLVDNALSFDGIDDYIDVPDDPSLRFNQSNSFSICFWAKPVSSGYIVCKMRASNCVGGIFGYEVSWSSSKSAFAFSAEKSCSGWVDVYTPDNSASAGGWYHVVAVYDNKDMAIYLNGQLKGSGTFRYDTGYTSPDKNLAIGARSVDSIRAHYFGGSIDDLRIYDGALSASEVSAIYLDKPIIYFSPTEFDFTALQDGPNPPDQILTIRNIVPNSLNWQISEDCDWLTAEPNTGSSTGEINEVTLSVDVTALTRGSYICELTISDPCAANNPQTVDVNLTISGPVIELSATEFEFIATAGGPNPQGRTFAISNSSGGTLNWQLAADCDWLITEPNTGSSTGETDEVTLSVDVTALAEGSYICELTISDPCAYNSPQTVTVNLLIGSTIYVPADYSTIQAAIDAASYGDTIIVESGTYNEDINFRGKNIILTSAQPNNPAATVIQGTGTNSSVVTFSGSETAACKLAGFTITGGNTSYFGGGIYGHKTHAEITNCIITNNIAHSYGGGLYECNGQITNCFISGNTTKTSGSGLARCSGSIINCTIMGNFSTGEHSRPPETAAVLSYCNGQISNCIIWYNEPDILYGCVQPSYSCLPDAGSGTGNIDTEPAFIFPDSYYLSFDSPCIDAGDNTVLPSGVAVDIEGNPRFCDVADIPDTGSGTAPIVDMGVCEYDDSLLQPVVSPSVIDFLYFQGGPNPQPQILSLANHSRTNLNWTISSPCLWLQADPAEGSSAGEIDQVTLSADVTGLSPGTYNCELPISDPCTAAVLKTVPVNLTVGGIIFVPADYPTIQAAIDAAGDGDTIIVSPGMYEENINFLGKKIIVKSSNPNNWETVRNTIINGNTGGWGDKSCVIFNHGEDNSSILEGFTLTGGTGTDICYRYENRITCGQTGGGILCLNSSPVIRRCNIVKNGYDRPPYPYPHPYQFYDSYSPVVEQGGGIALIGNCHAVIEDCFIANNEIYYPREGGGSGIIIRSDMPEQATSTIKNCTIANNKIYYPRRPRYEVDCWDTHPNISNTIIYNNYDNIRSLLISDPALVTYSCIKDAYQFNVDYEDSFPYDVTAAGGNINEGPLFSDPFASDPNYHLLAGSPCINAGDPAYSPRIGQMDIDGQPRLMGGRLDIGADEVVPEITVDRPSAGDVWTCGSEHEIQWRGYGASAVDIKFSSNAGGSWQVIEGAVADTGRYSWLVPDRVNSNSCLISVVPSVPDANVVCTAGGPFTIQSYHSTPLPRGRGPQIDDGPQQFGSVKWQFQTSGPVRSAAAVVRNKVYIASEDGVLYCLNASDGSALWSYDTNSPLLGSPAVAPDGTVYIGAKDGRLYAINGRGRLLWTHTTGAPLYSAPVVSPDGTIYTCSLDGSLYVLAPDGSELWHFEMDGFGGLPGSIIASPAIAADGTIYIAGLYDPNLYALNADGSLRWLCNFEFLVHPDDPDNNDTKAGWPYACPAVAADGTLYQTLLFDPNLYALAPDDGDIIWGLDLSGAGSAWFDPNYASANGPAGSWTPPAVGPDGTIYVSFDDAYLRAVNPDGSLKWTSLLGTLGCFTLTVGEDGLIYAAGDGSHLYLVAPDDGALLAQFTGDGWLSFATIAARRTIIVSDANNIVWCIGQK